MVSTLIRMANGPDGDDGLDEFETGVATRTRPKTKKPSNYKVLMLNDDYTPMEFVVLVLQQFFSMSIEDATRVMLQVHQQGVAVCGVFTYEVAETKVTQVIDFAARTSTRCSARWRRPDGRCLSPSCHALKRGGGQHLDRGRQQAQRRNPDQRGEECGADADALRASHRREADAHQPAAARRRRYIQPFAQPARRF